jgi:hypothetical protein
MRQSRHHSLSANNLQLIQSICTESSVGYNSAISCLRGAAPVCGLHRIFAGKLRLTCPCRVTALTGRRLVSILKLWIDLDRHLERVWTSLRLRATKTPCALASSRGRTKIGILPRDCGILAASLTLLFFVGAFQSSMIFTISPISKSRSVTPAAIAESSLELLLDPAYLFAGLPG